jgi:hypothetical protein
MGAMQALERLWDRPALRWPFVLVAVVVLFAGVRLMYVQNESTASHEPIVKGGQPLGIAAYGPKIALPQKAVDAGKVFIHTAVLRKNLGRGWDISTPKVHAGLSRAQWMTGSIPVSPFPANAYGGTTYKVEWSRARNVTLLVQILADKPDVKSGYFFIQMVPRGKSWAVDYFGPRGTNPPIPASEVH